MPPLLLLLCVHRQVYGVVWNNFRKDRDGEGREFIVPDMFVTFGAKHLKFWVQEFDDVSGNVGSRGRWMLCRLAPSAGGEHAMRGRQ